VSGAADALEAAGHAGRRLDLHDEVDRPHVDAELETARRNDRGRRPPLSAFSISARCSLLTEPWCARARIAGTPAEAPD
jgi:hypothetical protein